MSIGRRIFLDFGDDVSFAAWTPHSDGFRAKFYLRCTTHTEFFKALVEKTTLVSVLGAVMNGRIILFRLRQLSRN